MQLDTSTTHPDAERASTEARSSHPLPWLIAAALLLALLGIGMVAQVALLLLTPYNSFYPSSLLALYSANYQPWSGGPLLPALNPQAVTAAGQSKLGHKSRINNLDAVPVASDNPVYHVRDAAGFSGHSDRPCRSPVGFPPVRRWGASYS